MQLGLDVGFGFTKVCGGGEQIVIPSVVGPGRERRLKGSLSNRVTKLIDDLDVTIDGQRLFVGNLAQRESLASAASLITDTANNPHKRILLLTAAALVAGEGNVQIITGLPIAEYRKYRNQYAEQMRGTVEVTINGSIRRLSVTDCLVFPQAAGAIWGELLDMGGRLVDTPLANSKIAVIDVGYRDTNWCVLDQLEYVDRESDSSPIGVHNAYKAVANELKDQGVDLLAHDVGRYIQREGYNAEGHYQDLATQIIGVLSTRWHAGEFKRILLAGGGAKLLEKYLVKAMGDKCWIVSDPQFANAKGFLKIAKMQWHQK